MDAIQIRAQRLLAQQLSRPRFKTPAALLAWMGAVQAQDRPASVLALALRLPGKTMVNMSRVEKAVSAKQLVRSWVPRGTLHWVAAKDLRWMLALLAPRIVQRAQTRLKELKINASDLARSQAAMRQALKGGKVLGRDELLKAVWAAGVSVAGQRGYHLLHQAGMAGLICFGPMVGKQAGLVLLDGWVPKGSALRREAALAKLARLYAQSRGPATLDDFRWWSGLDAAEAKAAWASLPTPKAAKASPSEGAWFLPSFDEWLISYADRSAVLDAHHADKVAPGANGLFRPILVLDGEVVGTWLRPMKGRPEPVLQPFKAFSPAQRARFKAAWDRVSMV
jgi:hypothetical protein